MFTPLLEREAPQMRTKEEVKEDLYDRFGFDDTNGFRACLAKGNIKLAKKFLQYIINNKEDIPQYHDTWDSWLADRRKEIVQEKLFKLFGLRKTSDFKAALESGQTKKIKKAKKFLQYIIDNKEDMLQYHATWDSWLNDRRNELEQIKGK